MEQGGQGGTGGEGTRENKRREKDLSEGESGSRN